MIMDLERLAALGRKLQRHMQALNRGGKVFLSDGLRTLSDYDKC